MSHNARALPVAVLAMAAALLVIGCGSGDAPKAAAISLQPPDSPTQADCGLTGAGSASEAEAPPEPGIYEYTLKGKRQMVSDTTTTTRLPASMQIIITDSVRQGGQSCFAMQRRYDKALGETGIFVINGSDYYIRSATFQAGGDITEVVPDPSILMLSGDQLEWSGAFSGATSGTYRAEALGRRSVKVGGRAVKAVQIETHVRYSGEIEGRDDATRWVAIDSGVILSEQVSQSRAFGLDTLKLDFKSQLTSLVPQ